MASQVLHLQHPYFAANASRAGVKFPKKVNVSTQALFQILSHAIRSQPDQPGVIGTLLGVRSEDGNEVDVKAAYVIPLTEDDNELTIHVDYHVEMYSLLRKAHPEYQIVGWYSPSHDLDHMASLIHDFYGSENGTFPHPPIRVAVDPETDGIDIEAFVSLPVFSSPENASDGCIFTPVPTVVKFNETDQPALAAAAESLGAVVPTGASNSVDDAIAEVLKQIDVVSQKVSEARKNSDSPASEELARFLYKVVSISPSLEAPFTSVPFRNNQPAGKADLRSAMYNSYMRDLVTIVNLANSIKRQVQLTSDVSAKLA